MPRALAHLSILLVAAGAVPARAQGSLASRIAQVSDGVVRMQYDARTGVCGDGHDVVGFRRAIFANNFESYGSWSDMRCVAGPVRVSLTMSAHRPTGVRTQIGGAWPVASERVTDLGVVASREAASWFVAHVAELEGTGRKGRVLLPAVLAADAAIVPELLRLARDPQRTVETRRQAVQWVGQLGDASVVPALVGFARAGSGDGAMPGDEQGDAAIDRRDKKGVASAALSALATLEDGAGVAALIDLARTGDATVRHSAVFWLGQTNDPRALRTLHEIIESPREIERVRANAIFALAHGDATSPAEFAYLRGIFPRLETAKLKESVLQGMAEDDGGGRWLLDRARDNGEDTRIRRSALFWAGQREATPTGDLVAAYRDLGEASLREHAIFVLSQRDDNAAIDALLRIAREDPDRRMRSKALFWLAQKNDERVTKLISDLLVK
jgi:HEAT repeat protein